MRVSIHYHTPYYRHQSRVSFICLISHFDVSLIQPLLLFRGRSTEAECNELDAMTNAVLFFSFCECYVVDVVSSVVFRLVD